VVNCKVWKGKHCRHILEKCINCKGPRVSRSGRCTKKKQLFEANRLRSEKLHDTSQLPGELIDKDIDNKEDIPMPLTDQSALCFRLVVMIMELKGLLRPSREARKLNVNFERDST
jgi:hypothetical protein